jgi:cytidylate kinase
MSNKLKIAISGKSGCGNSSVSRMVAERLGLELINYTFHDMARERGMEFEEFCRLAEQDSRYDRELDRKQVEMCAGGSCVLGSRLAIWLLEDADLSVYLYASLDTRAARIAEREGGSLEEKREETKRRDRRDHARYKRLYGIDNDRYDFVDLVVNTDNMTAAEVADTIVAEANKRSPGGGN